MPPYEIPVVDFADLKYLAPEDPKFERRALKISREIHDAFTSVGFLYLVNHGVDLGLINDAFKVGKEFFQLPTSTKTQFGMRMQKTGDSDTDYDVGGYTLPGQEMLEGAQSKSSIELRETFDIQFTNTNRTFPAEDQAPDFIPTISALEESGLKLANKFFKCIAIALELPDKDFFKNVTKHIRDRKTPGITDFRVLYYPPVPDDVQADAIRLSEHTDYIAFTLLYQDQIGGLEVQHRNGTWIEAKPLENSIVINVGDLLEFWTAGTYRSTPHRVLVPELEIKKKMSRQSMAHFITPDDDAMISPLLESPYCGEDVAKYPRVNAKEHVMKRLVNTY